jgi:hypothetical protein
MHLNSTISRYCRKSEQRTCSIRLDEGTVRTASRWLCPGATWNGTGLGNADIYCWK